MMKEYIYRLDDDCITLTSEDITRCRDCARYIPQETYKYNSGITNKATCEVIRGFVVQIDPDGYCAWGERA